MKYKSFRLWIVAGITGVSSLAAGTAQAQVASNTPTGGGVMQLPKGVTKVVSIDTQNVLLVESVDADGNKHYNIIRPRHVYSGGLARIFGGSIISTEQLVIPESANRNGIGVNNGITRIGGNQPFQNTAPFSGTVPPVGTGTISGGGLGPLR
jgi:hypothetical protein